ncbi:MAG: sensory histidine kinase AtoS [Candidatus Methanofastidiosum methylothiophilum]|uniref:histidine kinase n=1 Tax=Candidatus Methanofastidiosum methylothiophilum TaxID=1705564 RepID=A0A150J940_9EURY|nr:MAG: sensory histidine kinase AtoS [Candidatus Methanofastidiosum methylthiophilus]
MTKYQYKRFLKYVQKKNLIEEELKEIGEQYRSLIRESMDAIWFSTIEGKIVDANEAAAKLLGVPLTTLIGTSILDFYVDPLDRLKFQEKVEKEGSIKGYEISLKNIKGQQLFCLFTSSIWKDKKGKIIGYRGIVHDITKRKKMGDSLKRSEEKYRELVEYANSIIAKLDEHGRVLSMNEYGLNFFGYSKEELFGKIWQKIGIPALDSTGKNLENLIFDIFSDIDKHAVNINENIKKNGERCWIYWTNRPIKNEKGELKGVFCVGSDITERILSENRIRELNETLSILNKILRHDILNDLTIVANSLDMINTPDDFYKCKALNALDKSISLIEMIKELEHAVTTDDKLKYCPLREIINQIIVNYPEVEFKVSGDCIVYSDDAIFSVFHNLIRNAIIHGKSDRIDIDISNKENICEVRVADYGTGIPDHIKDRVFEEGYSHGDSRNTGLGLYISKKVIERYGGSILLEDNEPKGAVFILTLAAHI